MQYHSLYLQADKNAYMPILERKIVHDMATVCSHISYPRFVLPLHKHVGYEIMLFTQGSGKQFVGEGVSDYKAGDIAFIGSNVPHLHLCHTKLDATSASNPEEKGSAGEAIQFRPDIFPGQMEGIPDYHLIHDLLQKSQYGIRFYDEGLFDEMLEMVREFDSSGYTSRIVCLLRMLEKLHDCQHFRLLSDTAYNQANLIPDVKEPVNKVYAYLYNHFKEKVTLGEIAEFVNQNPAALCRYFKQRTDRSIFQCLAEIRIEHACKLLTYSKMNVSQIAYESGYNSVTHFVAQFEKITKRTPSEYRMLKFHKCST